MTEELNFKDIYNIRDIKVWPDKNGKRAVHFSFKANIGERMIEESKKMKDLKNEVDITMRQIYAEFHEKGYEQIDRNEILSLSLQLAKHSNKLLDIANQMR